MQGFISFLRINVRSAHEGIWKTGVFDIEKSIGFTDALFWRRHPDLDRGVADLQSAALPLGYGAIFNMRA